MIRIRLILGVVYAVLASINSGIAILCLSQSKFGLPLLDGAKHLLGWGVVGLTITLERLLNPELSAPEEVQAIKYIRFDRGLSAVLVTIIIVTICAGFLTPKESLNSSLEIGAPIVIGALCLLRKYARE